MATKIWSQPGNPTPGVAKALNVSRRQLGEALHEIKGKNNLGPRDRVEIWDDGNVTDHDTGEWLGNIHDEI